MCDCPKTSHDPILVALTGGPGAGKTAVLETMRRELCEHVLVLPEAASIVFGGGFPRERSLPYRCAAQRAIFRVQRELERSAIESRRAAVVLCDRGTIDGVAYWPMDEASFWLENETTPRSELARYAAVIHLRTPPPAQYDRRNPLRIEDAREAAAIDERIARAWATHPHLHVVPSNHDFLVKVQTAIALVREDVPDCCRMAARAPAA
jgi:predicted ATPase